MKKAILLLALCIATTLSSVAQISAYAHKISNRIEGYSLPRTIIKINVVQEREVIIKGPYAAYAHKFLGIVGAPMTDKESYKILGANLSYTTEPDPELIYDIDPKNGISMEVFQWLDATPATPCQIPADADFKGAQVGNHTLFQDMGTNTIVTYGDELQVDRITAVEKTEEQMAADAADMIFKLRRRRIELITGEQGEHVFGEGLKAALKEITRLEKKYLQLFVGQRMTQKTTKTFTIIPQKGQANIVAFRFSPIKGVVDAADNSANPVNLSITKITQAKEPAQRKLASKVIKLRVPSTEKLTLTDGTTVFCSEIVPIYQNGVIVDAPTI